MAVSRDYLTFIEDLLEPLGGVSIRPMFGGAGVFRDGVMFGLIADETLYLKADGQTCADFEAEQTRQFIYEGRTRTVAMPYWQAPERLYEETEEMSEWARRAFETALREKKPAKRARTRRA